MPYKDPQARRAYHNEYTRNNARRVRAFLHEAKSRPCADCGIQYPPYVMQFDHIGPKLYDSAGMCNRSVGAAAKEIKNCEVVCANCHAERTQSRRKPLPYREPEKPDGADASEPAKRVRARRVR